MDCLRWSRWAIPLCEMDISCCFLGDYRISVHCEARCLRTLGELAIFFTRWASEEENELGNHSEKRHDCAEVVRVYPSCLAHGRTHPHFHSVGWAVSACRRLRLNPLWMFNGVSWFFWGGRGLFSALRHCWLGKEMDRFADFPLSHYFNSESHRGTSPADFGHRVKR